MLRPVSAVAGRHRSHAVLSARLPARGGMERSAAAHELLGAQLRARRDGALTLLPIRRATVCRSPHPRRWSAGQGVAGLPRQRGTLRHSWDELATLVALDHRIERQGMGLRRLAGSAERFIARLTEFLRGLRAGSQGGRLRSIVRSHQCRGRSRARLGSRYGAGSAIRLKRAIRSTWMRAREGCGHAQTALRSRRTPGFCRSSGRLACAPLSGFLRQDIRRERSAILGGLANLRRRQAFILAVVTLAQIRVDGRKRAQTREFARLTCTAED